MPLRGNVDLEAFGPNHMAKPCIFEAIHIEVVKIGSPSFVVPQRGKVDFEALGQAMSENFLCLNTSLLKWSKSALPALCRPPTREGGPTPCYLGRFRVIGSLTAIDQNHNQIHEIITQICRIHAKSQQ